MMFTSQHESDSWSLMHGKQSTYAKLDIEGSQPHWKLPGRKHVPPPPPLHELSSSLIVMRQFRGWDIWGTGRRGPVQSIRGAAIWHGWSHGNWTSDRMGEDLNSVMRRRIVYNVKERRHEGKKMVPSPPMGGAETMLLPANRRSLATEESMDFDLGLPARLKRPPGMHASATSAAHYELLSGRSIARVSDPRGGVPGNIKGDKSYKRVEASPNWKPVLSGEYTLDFARTMTADAKAQDRREQASLIKLAFLPRVHSTREVSKVSTASNLASNLRFEVALVRGLENWQPAQQGF